MPPPLAAALSLIRASDVGCEGSGGVEILTWAVGTGAKTRKAFTSGGSRRFHTWGDDRRQLTGSIVRS